MHNYTKISGASALPLGTDQACSVKVVGYWPSKICHYAAILTKQAWSIKDLLYGIKKQREL